MQDKIHTQPSLLLQPTSSNRLKAQSRSSRTIQKPFSFLPRLPIRQSACRVSAPTPAVKASTSSFNDLLHPLSSLNTPIPFSISSTAHIPGSRDKITLLSTGDSTACIAALSITTTGSTTITTRPAPYLSSPSLISSISIPSITDDPLSLKCLPADHYLHFPSGVQIESSLPNITAAASFRSAQAVITFSLPHRVPSFIPALLSHEPSAKLVPESEIADYPITYPFPQASTNWSHSQNDEFLRRTDESDICLQLLPLPVSLNDPITLSSSSASSASSASSITSTSTAVETSQLDKSSRLGCKTLGHLRDSKVTLQNWHQNSWPVPQKECTTWQQSPDNVSQHMTPSSDDHHTHTSQSQESTNVTTQFTSYLSSDISAHSCRSLVRFGAPGKPY
ncbi:unnamed protein product [Protopolystoma xenopodis]|uniref:Uncharacterized protein n=1 Tax=Protopolystoma xenopodis TaxID=117903 RepID=A0A448X363_9PLAT|nr:unnamed protein product [Protopolystoma xenopodis]